MKQYYIVFLAIICIVTLLAGCSSNGISNSTSDSTDDEMPTVRVAYMPDIHGAAPLVIGEEKGYFEDAGIKVKPVKFNDGPTEFQAMVSGDIDIAYIGPGATYLAAKGQGNIITIDSLNTGDMVLAKKESGIKDFKDLKGKKVGVPEGTSGDMILTLGLSEAGMDKNDIDAVNMDVSNEVSAFISDKIDAAAIWNPYSNEIEKEVEKSNITKLADGSDFGPEYTFPQSWVASPEFMEEHDDETEKFLEAWTKANDYRKEHTDEAVEMTADSIDVPEDSLESMVETTEFLSSDEINQHFEDGDVSTWYENLQNLFVKTEQMDKAVDPDKFVKGDILNKVLKE